MTRYSVQSRNQLLATCFGFLCFAENIGKNTDKNISKNLSSKYSQKLLDHAKQSATGALKNASKRLIQKQLEQRMICLGIKLLIKLQRNHHKMFQRQLKVK